MRKLLLFHALLGLLWAVCSVGVASAGVQEPEEYGGHGMDACEAPTHASWYDPRNEGQTVYDPERPNGDNVYYVDDKPLDGFEADGDYDHGQAAEDCQGTAVVRMTAYGAVTVKRENGYIRQGFPKCDNFFDDTRNPSCEDDETGASGGFYVGTGDGAVGVGYTTGVTPLSDG
ncbi:MAG TPA: hypothetical protein VNB64_02300 [Solirubrobacteraceae bacterium]|nr:hypothetical protein [Solirubrobacteraceae bacterium]